MDKTINDYILRLSGKASLLKPLENGNSYKVLVDGEITSETLENNQDGTYNIIYKFTPALVEIVKDNGETIKAKDIRKRSVQLRNSMYKVWQNKDVGLPFEDFYEAEMGHIIKNYIDEHQ